jgi:polyisoprenoid-binding protein YceI
MQLMKIHRFSRWCALALFPSVLFPANADEVKVVQEQSTVEVSVKATGDDFVAKLANYDAKIDADAKTAVPLHGSVSWNFKDLKTGNKGRDKEMLHWLEQGRFPEAKFTLKDCALKGGECMATGQLEIHGMTRTIAFPLRINHEGANVTYSGDVVLDHRDFGLEKIVKFLVLKVDPVLSVHFKLHGTTATHGAVDKE